jgi:hypothetical protein
LRNQSVVLPAPVRPRYHRIDRDEHDHRRPKERFVATTRVPHLGGVPESEWNSASAVVDPDGAGPRIYLQQVPEPEAGKNRLHLDLNVGGDTDVAIVARKAKLAESVERLSKLDASTVNEFDQRGEFWIVMQDPEDNEFCLQ